MNKRIRLLTAAAGITGAGSVWAGELGHYRPGLANIRDFVVPEPGFYGLLYNYFYNTNTRTATAMRSVPFRARGRWGVRPP